MTTSWRYCFPPYNVFWLFKPKRNRKRVESLVQNKHLFHKWSQKIILSLILTPLLEILDGSRYVNVSTQPVLMGPDMWMCQPNQCWWVQICECVDPTSADGPRYVNVSTQPVLMGPDMWMCQPNQCRWAQIWECVNPTSVDGFSNTSSFLVNYKYNNPISSLASCNQEVLHTVQSSCFMKEEQMTDLI